MAILGIFVHRAGDIARDDCSTSVNGVHESLAAVFRRDAAILTPVIRFLSEEEQRVSASIIDELSQVNS